jgi:prophage maintenance system killer protein
LTYLALQGVELAREPFLEDIMVYVAEGQLDEQELASLLFMMAKKEGLI